MSDPIIFYCEVVSPYAYIGAHTIEKVAAKHGREVLWRPVSLGHIWKAIGATNVGPAAIPAKARYLLTDSGRAAKMAGLPMAKPAVFPVDAKLVRLAFYRLNARDPDLAKKFMLGVFDKYWAKSEEITTVAHLSGLAGELGIETSELEAALEDGDAKAAMIEATNAAVDSGAFGMPWFVVGDQVFWGSDRVPHIDQYLAFKAGK